MDSVMATTPGAETATSRPRRRVERVATAGGTRASRRAEFAGLDTEDAAIPFERVPYVPADLRRVALMAFFIIVLIVVGGWYISQRVF